MPVPGPVLELTRGERVAINIVNRSHDKAAIHWHGIELESFPDGVPGWSGAGNHVLPMIAPGDSFTVRFTPTRAGTFMYRPRGRTAAGCVVRATICARRPSAKGCARGDRGGAGAVTSAVEGGSGLTER
ncbi:MAG TPA: multicopper oxidase domain-containing protein [Gemmatimonadaceae bacterium]|nr:multicopper oxidase domain-containing protein [Gemmatimonadaceae bacterium]